jgi:acetolactate synthase I/II/III large subunit
MTCVTPTSEQLAAFLVSAGIHFVMHVPGGPLMPFLSAGQRLGLDFVLCRHEAGAGFLAEGLARVTRKIAVVAVTAGPGVTNVVTPVYVAQREWTPLFILSAQVAHSAEGRGAAQELDTVTLLRPVTKRSVALQPGECVTAVLDDLFAEAKRGRPGPVHLSVAVDLWKAGVS